MRVAARTVLAVFAMVVPLLLLAFAFRSIPPTSSGETVLANVSFADGSTRRVLYTSPNVAVWQLPLEALALPMGGIALTALWVFASIPLVAISRPATDPSVASGRMTVIRGLRRRPSVPGRGDRAA